MGHTHTYYIHTHTLTNHTYMNFNFRMILDDKKVYNKVYICTRRMKIIKEIKILKREYNRI